jgi:hypothetical protein
MYWQRDLIDWKSEPKIFGKQQALSTPVDFSKQKAFIFCTTTTPWCTLAVRLTDHWASGYTSTRLTD